MSSGSRVGQTVEADTTVNSTDDDLIGKTDENIVSLSITTRGPWHLLIQKITVLVSIISHP